MPLAAVLGFHAGLVLLLVSGFGEGAPKPVPRTIMTRLVAEDRPPPPVILPPPAPRLMVASVPYIPPPEILVARPVESGPAVFATPTPAPTGPVPAKAAPAAVAANTGPIHLAPAIDQDRPCRPPDYPAGARRERASGTVALKFLIEPDGTVSDSAIEQSSGHALLDEAARAALGRCHFKPGTADGIAERAWAHIRYVWSFG